MAGRQRDEERACSDKGKGKNKEEDTRAAEMDDLGSEVFNLKLALQEYEDRLSKLYQTEDRSKWKGPATLLVSVGVKQFLVLGSCVDAAVLRSRWWLWNRGHVAGLFKRGFCGWPIAVVSKLFSSRKCWWCVPRMALQGPRLHFA